MNIMTWLNFWHKPDQKALQSAQRTKLGHVGIVGESDMRRPNVSRLLAIQNGGVIVREGVDKDKIREEVVASFGADEVAAPESMPLERVRQMMGNTRVSSLTQTIFWGSTKNNGRS